MQYDNLPGRSRENAKKALELAEERGFSPELVLTTRSGYLIPLDADVPGVDVAVEEEVDEIVTEPGTEGNPPVEIEGQPVDPAKEGDTPVGELTTAEGEPVKTDENGELPESTENKTEEEAPVEEAPAEEPKPAAKKPARKRATTKKE